MFLVFERESDGQRQAKLLMETAGIEPDPLGRIEDVFGSGYECGCIYDIKDGIPKILWLQTLLKA